MVTRLEDVRPELVVDFDHLDQAQAGSMVDRLSEIRTTCPVAYSTSHGGFWLVTGYEPVHQVLTEWENFSSLEAALPLNHGAARVLPVESDPPEHTGYRQVLNPLFSPRRMQSIEPEIRIQAIDLIEAFRARGSCEFVSEFAHPLPTGVFISLMGWPAADVPLFVKWNEDILIGAPEQREVANDEVFAYFGDMITARRQAGNDGDDVTAMLLNSVLPSGDMLTDDELRRMLWVLMMGGLHTVRSVLAFGILRLAGDPETRRQIVTEPAVVPHLVEELLRLCAPVSPARTVSNAVRVGRVAMEPGDRVLVALPAACRDPAEFPDPEALAADRHPNRHLAFNAGPHRCLGSTLARIELAVALREFHAQIPDYEVVQGTDPLIYGGQIIGINDLRIQFPVRA